MGSKSLRLRRAIQPRFSTTKKILIRHSWLGYCHLIFQILALCYAAFQIIYFQQYIRVETPAAVFNIWSLSGNDYIKDIPPEAGELYCHGTTNTSYDNPAVGLYNFTCREDTSDMLIALSYNQIFITTAEGQTFVENGMAYAQQSFLYRGSEYIPFSFKQAVTVSFLQQTDIPTTIFDHNGNVFRTSSSGLFQDLRPVDLLNLTGTSLDSINTPDPALTSIFGPPSYRSSGIIVVVTAEYTNMRFPNPLFQTVSCEMRARVVPNLWGFLNPQVVYQEFPRKNVRLLRIGVQIQFISTGSIARFDIISLVTGIVSGIVLVGFASWFMTLVATLLYRDGFLGVTQETVSLQPLPTRQQITQSFSRSISRLTLARSKGGGAGSTAGTSRSSWRSKQGSSEATILPVSHALPTEPLVFVTGTPPSLSQEARDRGVFESILIGL